MTTTADTRQVRRNGWILLASLGVLMTAIDTLVVVTVLAGTQLNGDARCEALFASALEPSDAPTAAMISTAITRAVRQFGVDGCAARMAQEFGDRPETAASRMRWVRRVAGSSGPQEMFPWRRAAQVRRRPAPKASEPAIWSPTDT
jgi:hypothetical protein